MPSEIPSVFSLFQKTAKTKISMQKTSCYCPNGNVRCLCILSNKELISTFSIINLVKMFLLLLTSMGIIAILKSRISQKQLPQLDLLLPSCPSSFKTQLKLKFLWGICNAYTMKVPVCKRQNLCKVRRFVNIFQHKSRMRIVFFFL